MLESLHLESLTANTVNSVDPLLEELSLVQEQGFSLDNEEFYEGMIAIAVPVLDPKGRYHGALAMHGPTLRLDISTIKDHYSDLRSAADQLSDLIFAA
jgi:DNA-binding IclR family transcriptional regulator